MNVHILSEKKREKPSYFYFVYFTLSKAVLSVTLEKSVCRDINSTHAVNEYVFCHRNLSNTDWITEQCYILFILFQQRKKSIDSHSLPNVMDLK